MNPAEESEQTYKMRIKERMIRNNNIMHLRYSMCHKSLSVPQVSYYQRNEIKMMQFERIQHSISITVHPFVLWSQKHSLCTESKWNINGRFLTSYLRVCWKYWPRSWSEGQLWVVRSCGELSCTQWHLTTGEAWMKASRCHTAELQVGLLFFLPVSSCTVLSLTNCNGTLRGSDVCNTVYGFRNRCPSPSCHLEADPHYPQENYQSYWCQSGRRHQE